MLTFLKEKQYQVTFICEKNESIILHHLTVENLACVAGVFGETQLASSPFLSRLCRSFATQARKTKNTNLSQITPDERYFVVFVL